MIAVDTNILVYAHRIDCEFNDRAFEAIALLATGRISWAIPWPCVHEFFAIVTHPRVWDPPTPADRALEQLDAWLGSPSVVLLAEPGAHWPTLRDLLQRSRTVGPKVHDARIAAICMAHGVRELWTADRDFSRFDGVTARNPLLGP